MLQTLINAWNLETRCWNGADYLSWPRGTLEQCSLMHWARMGSLLNEHPRTRCGQSSRRGGEQALGIKSPGDASRCLSRDPVVHAPRGGDE